jgi:hypothetical protein
LIAGHARAIDLAQQRELPVFYREKLDQARSQRDPGERKNIATERPGQLKTARTLLDDIAETGDGQSF